jgi:hypothetical protein
MYYPLLKAEQFKLIMLRELASQETTQYIIAPIF